MIKFELASPMVLEKQLEKIIPALKMDPEDMYGLLRGCKCYSLQDDEMGHKAGVIYPMEETELTTLAIGCDAILKLCAVKGVEIKPITAVDIPDEVRQMCTESQWWEIYKYAMATEISNRKAKELMEKNCPKYVVFIELINLRDRLERLEDILIDCSGGRYGIQ